MGEQAHGDEELAIVNVEHARRISDTFRPNKTKKKSVIPKTVVQEIWKNRLAPRFYSTLMKVMFPENAKEVSFLSFYTIYKNLAEPEAEIMFRALTIYHIATIHEPPFNYEQADEYPNAPLKNIKDYVCDVITSYLHAIIQVQVKEALGWMELRASNSLVDGNLVAAYLLKDLEAHRNEVSIGSLEIWLEKNEIYYTVSEQLYLYLFGVNKSIDVKSLIPFPIVQGTKSANLKTLLSLPDVLLLNSKLPKRAPRWTLAFLLDSRNSGDWETFKQVIYGRGQTMIVIQDGNGDVFGMYGSQQWFPTTGFFGNRQSFLFTLKPDVNVYEPSGRNTNFQIFTESGIGLGGTEASPGLFINWTLRVGTTSTRCVTFNKFWQLSRDLVFDIKLVELWVVNEVLSRKRNIPHRDFYNTVVMWSKIGRNKDGNEKTKGRKQNAASCPAGTCCGCQQPEQAPSHVQIEETDLQYFDPSCISEPYQNCEEFHPYNTSATPCFTSCECAATQTSNYQIPTGRYAAVNANTPCTQRIPRYKAASTGMSRSTLYSNNSACVQTTRSLQDNNCNITTTQQSSCQTTPVPRKLPTRRISCQTSSSRMRSATTPNSCQTTSSLQNSSTRRVSCQTSSSIQNPSNRSSPSHQESPGPVSQQNIKMDDVIVGITRQEMCCCGSNIPEIECFCSKRFKKNKKDKKNKKSRKSDKESKKEERERAKREKIEEKERKKREKQEEKERKKEEKKKGKKKDKKKKGDKKSNECVCCKCEEFTTVDEDQSDSSDTHKSKKSKKKKEKKKKEKKPKEKKQKGSKKSKKEKQTSKERSKSRSRSRSRETTCRMYGDARPCYCPMNPTTQPVASPSRVEVRDVPRRQSSRKLDKDCHIGCGCPTSGAPIVCPPCPPTKPVAYYSQKPPTIMSEDVRQNYSSSSVKLNPSCSSSCNCFKIKSICSCNCSHKVNNYSVTVGPREVPYNEVHDSVDSTGNNYQTAAPAMLLPNVEMGKGDSTDPTFIGKLAKSELPRLTPLPATYTQTGNIVINVSKREEGTNANNKSYSKHFVPPCVLYLDCTKVKDMCVIIRDKYEET